MLCHVVDCPTTVVCQDQDDHHDKAVEAGQAPLLIRERKALVGSHYYSVVQWAVGFKPPYTRYQHDSIKLSTCECLNRYSVSTPLMVLRRDHPLLSLKQFRKACPADVTETIGTSS